MPTSSTLLFSLLRSALWPAEEASAPFVRLSEATWQEIYTLSVAQGVLALAYEGLLRLPHEAQPPRPLKIQWAYNVDCIEKRYEQQVQVAERLVAMLSEHQISMMIIKGLGLSNYYPQPHHRQFGDLDIWLYGKQAEADTIVRQHGIPVSEDVHHHTTFVMDGILVENHFDFVNVHAHASSKIVESYLQKYAKEPYKQMCIGGREVALPAPDFNALFLLRHAASHFAATEIGVRHLVDWVVFLREDSERVNWPEIVRISRELNMHRFLSCLNALATDYLGLPAGVLPSMPMARDTALETRILKDILAPEFQAEPPRGVLPVIWFKSRRWWANRWKHRLVYRESLLRTFIQSSYSHLLKPKTITH